MKESARHPRSVAIAQWCMTHYISSGLIRRRRVDLLNSKADLEAADRRFHFHSQTDPTRLETDGPLTIARGQGPYVFDLEGRKYLDAVASLWCASLGFSDRRLAAAGAAALETLPVYHTFNQRSNPYAAELSSLVCGVAPLDGARVFFTDGGSEAVDS